MNCLKLLNILNQPPGEYKDKYVAKIIFDNPPPSDGSSSIEISTAASASAAESDEMECDEEYNIKTKKDERKLDI